MPFDLSHFVLLAFFRISYNVPSRSRLVSPEDESAPSSSYSRSIRENDSFKSRIRPLFGTLDYVGFQEITDKQVLPDGRYISEKEFYCATADASNR